MFSKMKNITEKKKRHSFRFSQILNMSASLEDALIIVSLSACNLWQYVVLVDRRGKSVLTQISNQKREEQLDSLGSDSKRHQGGEPSLLVAAYNLKTLSMNFSYILVLKSTINCIPKASFIHMWFHNFIHCSFGQHPFPECCRSCRIGQIWFYRIETPRMLIITTDLVRNRL